MDATTRKFWKYVIPSVLSFALTGIYCFVDAYFVGNMVGDAGLAAVNISFAFISIVFSLGGGIGAGSSVKYSFYKAQNRRKIAGDYIGAAMVMMLISTIVVTIPMLVFPEQILLAFGASQKVAGIGRSYLVINGFGSIFQMFTTSAVPVVRNCGGVVVAMTAVVSSCLLNIFLDWLFVWVFGWGMNGAAYATVLAQVLSCVVCLVYLIHTRNFRFGCRKFTQKALEIVRIGVSPFGLCLVPNISVIILNKASLYWGGDPAIAAYGCMAYLVYVVYLIMQGVGDGAQPLISTFHGAGDPAGIRKVRRLVCSVTLGLALVFFLVEFFFSGALGRFMGASDESEVIIEKGLPVLALGFFFVGLSRGIASCLYAEEHNIKSYIISYSEPLFILLSLLVLPASMGLNSVWWSNTIAQFIVMVIALFLLA